MTTWPGTSIPKSAGYYKRNLGDYAKKAEAHKTMVRHRMLRGNPYLPDGAGNGSE